jgi:hypothetical protein
MVEIVCGTISESLNLHWPRPPLIFGPFLLLVLVADPSVNLVGNLRDQQEVVTSERVGGFPLLAVLVKTGERGVETDTAVGVVFPDCRLDGTKSNLVNGLFFVLFRHGAVALCFNGVLQEPSPRIRAG